MPSSETLASCSNAAQTTRQACPDFARYRNHTRLLRVEPPRGGAYEAFEVSRIRKGSEPGLGLLLGQQPLHLFIGKAFDFVDQSVIFRGITELIGFNFAG